MSQHVVDFGEKGLLSAKKKKDQSGKNHERELEEGLPSKPKDTEDKDQIVEREESVV